MGLGCPQFGKKCNRCVTTKQNRREIIIHKAWSVNGFKVSTYLGNMKIGGGRFVVTSFIAFVVNKYFINYLAQLY
jgi:hypothetical protein